MNELMRKSKTTSIQQEFVSRIADEIGEMSAQILFVNNTFERGATQFSEKCKQLTVKNDKDEKEKCRDVVAERVTAKRGERRGKTHLDMYVFLHD
uniref:Uncharacterized protein n=1 Tax=Caenorhabditis japonica TaxID=281687 RepID=A0A8R1EDY6_CAEJA